MEHNAGRLSNEDASMLKWWDTELCNRVVDRCLQLHGGYGYMREYQVARAFADGRVQTIFGGTTEIMKEIIGRGLGIYLAAAPNPVGLAPCMGGTPIHGSRDGCHTHTREYQ